jgi:hypothetical protein
MTNEEAFERAYDALFRHRRDDMKHVSDCEQIWEAACLHFAAAKAEPAEAGCAACGTGER